MKKLLIVTIENAQLKAASPLDSSFIYLKVSFQPKENPIQTIIETIVWRANKDKNIVVFLDLKFALCNPSLQHLQRHP